jgi:predicted Rossmann fold nucleotide-binding protein DprA/Smf involved in DNA uptake
MSPKSGRKRWFYNRVLEHFESDKENFVRRNRIVAGMSEATIVIESADRGGSLITANMANDYNRDVLRFQVE